MRMGIMGGTFDPVHSGHIQLARAALENLKLDGVMLLPAGDPPHKQRTVSARDRLAMTRLAAQELRGIFPCGIEIERRGTTYTVDTLRELHGKNPDTQWFYIIGADTLQVLDSWKDFQDVAGLCAFAVCGRAQEAASRARMEELQRRYGARFLPMDFTGPDISSTEIRRRVHRGEEIDALVPSAVGEYIQAHGLYLSPLERSEILAKLEQNLKPERFRHTLGVAESAVRLAKRHGIPAAHAELAALLHDCAKHLSPSELRHRLETVQAPIGEAVDAAEMETANVLHAPVGAIVARQEYGVEHPAILSAIRRHTLGAADMSSLDALIYTADFIEPNRREFAGLARARMLAEENLYAAMCLCAELTGQYLHQQGGQAHPRTLAMLKHYHQTTFEHQNHTFNEEDTK